MPISSNEIKMYRSQTVSNASSNGGLMGSVEAVSGAASNLFPNASSTERQNGASHWRKLFFKVSNALNLALLNARVWQDTNTPGGDLVYFTPSTQRQTQVALPGSPVYYGCGDLDVTVLAGGSTLVVETEVNAPEIFRNGSLIRLSNKADPFAAGTEEWLRVSGAPVVAGTLVTLTLESPVQNTYLAGTSRVSSVYEVGNVQATADSFNTSSVGGSLVDPEDNVVPHGVGTIEQNWTLTFESASAYTIDGDTLGTVGAGNITAGAAPNNAAFGSPYFTLNPALFGGTFAVGNTITFSTHPASVPVFIRRKIPAGTAAQSNNSASFYIDGETS